MATANANVCASNRTSRSTTARTHRIDNLRLLTRAAIAPGGRMSGQPRLRLAACQGPCPAGGAELRSEPARQRPDHAGWHGVTARQHRRILERDAQRGGGASGERALAEEQRQLLANRRVVQRALVDAGVAGALIMRRARGHLTRAGAAVAIG